MPEVRQIFAARGTRHRCRSRGALPVVNRRSTPRSSPRRVPPADLAFASQFGPYRAAAARFKEPIRHEIFKHALMFFAHLMSTSDIAQDRYLLIAQQGAAEANPRKSIILVLAFVQLKGGIGLAYGTLSVFLSLLGCGLDVALVTFLAIILRS